MIARSLAPTLTSSDPTARIAFLATHRAIGVLKREMARVGKELGAGVKLLPRTADSVAPVVRQTPDQCIVQFGPVALTVSWLRNGSDAPHLGELMAVVWHGVIQARGEHSPERNGLRRARATPVSVWEESCVVSATDEGSWHWHPEGVAQEGYDTPELSARLLDQLRQAHDAVMQDVVLRDGTLLPA